ncbi:Bug family tripartite tricarboxylate transporter substrate binding protein [Candidimonas nitroreducens]|nr:tripartite tricarboxylate transporter substrate binding protein [Candidimonas nitroreducens]
MHRNRRNMMTALAGLTLAGVMPARAANWPQGPQTFVVPYTPGGGTDMLARALGQTVGLKLGTSVIVDNRSGAGGNIGAALVAHDNSNSKWLFTTNSIAISASLYKGLNYSIEGDLVAVSMITKSPLLLVVPGSGRIRTLEQLIELSKAKPDGLNYGSTGVGSVTHLGSALLVKTLGIKALHIPYKGASQITTALLANQIDFAMIGTPGAVPSLRQGTLRLLGVMGDYLPPGIAEAPLLSKQYPELHVEIWQAVFAPKSMPRAAVQRMHTEVQAVLKDSSVARTIAADGAVPLTLSQAGSAKFIAEDIERYRKILAVLKLGAT